MDAHLNNCNIRLNSLNDCIASYEIYDTGSTSLMMLYTGNQLAYMSRNSPFLSCLLYVCSGVVWKYPSVYHWMWGRSTKL